MAADVNSVSAGEKEEMELARGGTGELALLADGKTTRRQHRAREIEKERKRVCETVGQGSRGEWDRAVSTDGGPLKSKIEQRLLATLAEMWARSAITDGGGAIPCKKSLIFTIPVIFRFIFNIMLNFGNMFV